LLSALLPKPVVINSVIDILAETNPSFIRIAGWPTFLRGEIIEGSCLTENLKKKAEDLFHQFGKRIQWLPDERGFITPRVISMIINEAYFSLAEGISTAEEIDIAMKLGTAYPYGPFEWGNKIGLQNIATLLNRLSITQKRYTPAGLLVQETNKAI
jgi:3-hydroxybutyryl-CoA dehydrogenase